MTQIIPINYDAVMLNNDEVVKHLVNCDDCKSDAAITGLQSDFYIHLFFPVTDKAAHRRRENIIRQSQLAIGEEIIQNHKNTELVTVRAINKNMGIN